MKLRVALAQINPTVGDLEGNAALILAHAESAANNGAHVALFPEMALTGYPVEDLALRPSFQIASAKSIQVLAAVLPAKLVSIVGYLDHINGAPQNRVAVITEGKVVTTYTKCQLPNYGVFDEYRNFVPGDSTLVVRIHGIDVGILICEDLWVDGGVTSRLAARNPGLVLVPNGSPFERDKNDLRAALVKKRALEVGAPLV
jgi:NAD+ synthase (glutamine-hydrolysing)